MRNSSKSMKGSDNRAKGSSGETSSPEKRSLSKSRMKTPTPCFTSSRPSERSSAMASRMTVRLTPSVSPSSTSVGSLSPVLKIPIANECLKIFNRPCGKRLQCPSVPVGRSGCLSLIRCREQNYKIISLIRDIILSGYGAELCLWM